VSSQIYGRAYTGARPSRDERTRPLVDPRHKPMPIFNEAHTYDLLCRVLRCTAHASQCANKAFWLSQYGGPDLPNLFRPALLLCSDVFLRSEPIQEAREIRTRFAPITVCDKRLPFVSVSLERSSPVQKMNLGSQLIRHS
jgi:hypothetical protein